MKPLPGLRHRIRDGVAVVLSALPHFRGKGRLTMGIDALLTDYDDPNSFNAMGRLDNVRLHSDLRVFGDKFTFYYREYESDYLAILRKLYKRGNFLDVGSNIGIYIVCMADLVRGARGRIYSIEPLAANVARQKTNIELNGAADVVDLLELAVGETSGTVMMGGDFTTSSINGIVSPAGTVSVPLTTLDELVASGRLHDITLIKMDIEGYEPAVLRGARAFLERDRPILFAEFNRYRMALNGFDMAESWLMLKNLGYAGHKVVDGELVEIGDPGQHENLFFLPR